MVSDILLIATVACCTIPDGKLQVGIRDDEIKLGESAIATTAPASDTHDLYLKSGDFLLSVDSTDVIEYLERVESDSTGLTLDPIKRQLRRTASSAHVLDSGFNTLQFKNPSHKFILQRGWILLAKLGCVSITRTSSGETLPSIRVRRYLENYQFFTALETLGGERIFRSRDGSKG